MADSDSSGARTVTLHGRTFSLAEVAERMQSSLDEEMTAELKADIVERLDQLLDLRCSQHEEAPRLVESDDKGLRVETCCHELMDRVDELWSQ